MTPEERRFLRAQARWEIAEREYRNMLGYNYAIADERTAASIEMEQAARALLATEAS